MGKRIDPQQRLGEVTTGALLDELRLRGDLARTVHGATRRGGDGDLMAQLAVAMKSAVVGATLDAVRGR